MHPLNPRARWLILPGLSAAAGLIAGGVVTLGIYRGEVGTDLLELGAILGAASGLAVSITPKTWLALLIAPPLGLVGVAAYAVLENFPASPLRTLEGVLHPMFHMLTLMTTGLMVVLHGMRMKRKESWRWPFLALAVAAGVASGLTFGEAFYRSSANALVVFSVLLNLGCAVAMEAALRTSRTAR